MAKAKAARPARRATRQPKPRKGVQPGGRNVPAGQGVKHPKPAQPTPKRPRVNPGGLVIGLKPPARSPVQKPGKPKKAARGLAIGDLYPVCVPEALAASLRVLGYPVTDADIMDLFWWAAGDAEVGCSIQAAIEAAGERGLAGVRLTYAEMVEYGQPDCAILGLAGPQHTVYATGDGWWTWGTLAQPQEFPDAIIEEAWAVTWES